jgi:prephenate dehydrogenase
MTESPFRRIVIVGVGLIGGSFGAGVRRRFPGVHVRGIGRAAERLEIALRRGAIDDFRVGLGREGLADRDLVLLAAPIEQVLADLETLGDLVAPGTVVSDVGSTKREICARARQKLPAGVRFVGGHPMAGKEVTGIEHSDPDLLAGAPYVLCPAEGAEEALVRLRALVEGLGARPVVLAAEAHDAAVGWISHLPQLLSTALADVVLRSGIPPGELLPLAGGGFRDMVRLAGSSYDVWRSILETNVENVDAALGAAIACLADMRRQLGSSALDGHFERARKLYARHRALLSESRS